MSAEYSKLHDWTTNHIKHRDLFTKSIKEIIEQDNKIICKYENYEKLYLLMPILEPKFEDNITLICWNIEPNVDYLIKNWKKFASKKNLFIIFVDRDLKRKWIINPHVHNKIADPESIELGIRTMSKYE